MFLALGGVLLFSLTGALAFLWLVVFHPGDDIQPGSIERILAIETPIYFNDGETKIGVFFEEAHRQYLTYDEIPKAFVNSIVAAEDHSFFSHFGINPWAIMRAAVANLLAGRVVQGGSTITQQTAKNLFKRKSRSFVAKFKELIYALRLEYHYPKEKILEFYVNQFFVSGNGRGLGVAARYYFDKEPQELTLLECAFIAGSVKKPNYYNPFRPRTAAGKSEALRNARIRTDYVLNQMRRMDALTEEEYQRYLAEDIPFKKGNMTYKVNTIMDQVREAMAEPEVEEALRERGIDNMATSGIRIITTIDKNLQGGGEYALRKELSSLDIRLLGYDRQELQQRYAELPEQPEHRLEPALFFVGRIVEMIKDDEAPEIYVTMARNEEDDNYSGIIDREGLFNALSPLVRYHRSRWSEPGKKDMHLILSQLKVGDLVYASVRGKNQDGDYLLDLEKIPTLQGGLLSASQGRFLTMVGGFDNKYYNRVIAAKRPMGSVIKPLVYCAALQLGWNTTDILNNERNIFVYQYMPYFPRPDHHSPYSRISMNWAGVNSENVATIWLLYHLCDKLNPAQFKELVEHFGFAQGAFESYKEYEQRVRDELGIQVNKGTMSRLALDKAVAEIEADLVFEGKIDEYEVLRTFYYGDDFDRYLDETDAQFDEYLDDNDLDKEVEGELRRSLLSRNFLNFKRLRQALLLLKKEVEGDISLLPSATRMYREKQSGRYCYLELPPLRDGWTPLSRQELKRLLDAMGDADRQTFWDNVHIEGLLTTPTLGLLEEQVGKEYQKLAGYREYSSDILYNIRDFRVLVALRYLVGMCKMMGIESELEPVLSFPLGSNVINLVEVARVYEALTTGKVYTVGKDGTRDSLFIIDRVEDVDGELIYKPERVAKQVLDPRLAIQLGNILSNVVQYGTGRHARDSVWVRSKDPELDKRARELNLSVDLFGKTGTANRFTNSAFAGLVPAVTPEGNSVQVDGGLAVASYVGFDDNSPMVRRDTHISGSGGALQVWSRYANDVLLHHDYAAKLNLEDLQSAGVSQVPVRYPNLGQVAVPIDRRRGGVAAPDAEAGIAIVTFGEITDGAAWKPARFFRPYWLMEEY